MGNKITKVHGVTKTIFQIALYIIEIGLFSGVLTFLSFMYFDPVPVISVITVLERVILFYGIYQLIVFVILNNINDIKADEFLALKTNADLAVLALESNNEQIRQNVKYQIHEQLKRNMFNDTTVRKTYENLSKLVENNTVIGIKQISIWANHCYEESQLQWKFSFLLRLVK